MGGNGNSLGTVDVQTPIQPCGESMGRSMSEKRNETLAAAELMAIWRMCLATGTARITSSDSCQEQMPPRVRSWVLGSDSSSEKGNFVSDPEAVMRVNTRHPVHLP